MIDLTALKKKKTIQELLEFGIILIDKPSGPTSFSVSEYVKKRLGLKKTSHFGTLDPKVTGMLPVALSRGCKLSGYFLGEDKLYVGIMRFHETVSREHIEKAIQEKFVGVLTQLPPVRSRVKRAEREREVYSFEILEVSGKDVLFRVHCQGGTYIRKLVHDLGEHLTLGAHMLELRRTEAGIFSEEGEYPFITLYDFDRAVDAYEDGDESLLRKIIIPAEVILEVVPSFQVNKDALPHLLTGKRVLPESVLDKGKTVPGEKGVAFCKDQFVGVYRVTGEPEVFARPEFVLQPLQRNKK